MKTLALRRLLGVVAAAPPILALLLGGMSKLDDAFYAASLIGKAVGLPLTPAFRVAQVVGGLELVVAVAWCLSLGRSWFWPCVAAGVFSFFLGVLLAVLMIDPSAAGCGCFGGLMGRYLQKSLWTQVYIDAGLLGLTLASMLLLVRRPPRIAPGMDSAATAPPG